MAQSPLLLFLVGAIATSRRVARAGMSGGIGREIGFGEIEPAGAQIGDAARIRRDIHMILLAGAKRLRVVTPRRDQFAKSCQPKLRILRRARAPGLTSKPSNARTRRPAPGQCDAHH